MQEMERLTTKTDSMLNPCVDVIFKALFSQSDLLIPFLNAILKDNIDEPILSIVYLDTLTAKKEIDEKRNIFDMRVKLENGEQILVEMQMGSTSYMIARGLYYWGNDFGSQLKESEDWDKIKKCIQIIILENKLFKKTKKAHSVHHIRDDETLELTTDLLEMHFLELSKIKWFQKKSNPRLYSWMKFMTDPENVRDELATEPAIEKAVQKLNLLEGDKEMMHAYRQSLDQLRTQRTEMKMSREEGSVARAVAIAKNLLKSDLSIEFIAESTGLSVEEVKKLT
jgi:predicted transposase/invertase (TIGR01784 family)